MIANTIRSLLEALLPTSAVNVIMPGLAIFILINILLLAAIMLTLAERRVVARMQNRIGPNRVGPNGLLQGFADLMKLVLKEDITPRGADGFMFRLAPVMVFAPTLMMLAVVPFFTGWVIANLDAGIIYVIAITSLTSFGIFMAGWASNNKYSMYGAIRAVAQLVSYEVPMVLAAVSVVLLTGSMNVQKIVEAQGIPFALVQPLAFLIFMVAVTAELNRTPFDLMEAESEIVAGYHTEYTGTKFALFYGAEFIATFGWAAVITALFLSGWQPAFGLSAIGVFWFGVKSLAVTFVFFWFRATWPRVRIDQLLGLAWKVLFPLATLNLLVTAGEVLAIQLIFSLEPGERLPALGLVFIAAVNLGLTGAALLGLPQLVGTSRRPETRAAAETVAAGG